MSTYAAPRRYPRLNPFVALGWQLVLLVPAVGATLLLVLTVAFGLLSGLIVFLGPLLGVVLLLRGPADLHRTFARSVLGVTVERPYEPVPHSGLRAKLRTVFRDPATWRDLLWAKLNSVVAPVLTALNLALFTAGVGYIVAMPVIRAAVPESIELTGAHFGLWHSLRVDDVGDALVGIPVGLGYLAVWLLLAPWLARAHAGVAAALLRPTAGQRIRELARSRAESVDTSAAELRRIERDLHDGAQARLVSLGMSLGLAEQVVDRDPTRAKELLAEARAAGSQALGELRDLVRGMHPPVLADRGLDGALQALGLATPLPVDVRMALPGRPAAPVESAVYFAVSELLTNVAKHADAPRAWVRLWHDGTRLHVQVGDEGRGGARVEPGGGLRGVERRLAAFDGTLAVTSPPGGPTIVAMEVPCVLSSPRISPSCETA